MAKDDLKSFSERTADEQQKIARKGGKKSGEARRHKADLRAAAQTILDGVYKTIVDKETGETRDRTGAEIIILNAFKIAGDAKNKQCIAAAKLLMELTGANRTPEQVEIDKQEIELLKAKVKAMETGTAFADTVQIIVDRSKNEPS